MIEQHILDWFLTERGIKPETLEEFGVHQEGEYIIFPFLLGEKRRKDPTIKDKRVFLYTNGQSPDLFHNQNHVSSSKVSFLVEGESDTLRLSQALREAYSGPSEEMSKVYGLSGIETWQPHFADAFKDSEKVFVILDNDEDYSVKGRVDTVWRVIKRTLGRKAQRVILPAGVKDVCDFFLRYELDDLKELCKRRPLPNVNLHRLDLTIKPPPMDWLIEGLICKGDVNLLIGQPGQGKSFLAMDMALAVAGGKDNWLDHPVISHGPVMYLDEENPEDIIHHRFQKLGLDKTIANMIYYFYRPGLWLNKDPDTLLNEAVEIEPQLIILDSLSRLHNEDENNANAMATLFREAITPLARETGAAVIVIHHTIKSSAESGFQRARGSGDITAVVDGAFEVQGSDGSGRLYIHQYKSRRSLARVGITAEIRDIGDSIKISTRESELPF